MITAAMTPNQLTCAQTSRGTTKIPAPDHGINCIITIHIAIHPIVNNIVVIPHNKKEDIATGFEILVAPILLNKTDSFISKKDNPNEYNAEFIIIKTDIEAIIEIFIVYKASMGNLLLKLKATTDPKTNKNKIVVK